MVARAHNNTRATTIPVFVLHPQGNFQCSSATGRCKVRSGISQMTSRGGVCLKAVPAK